MGVLTERGQYSRCFYCFRAIGVTPGSTELADVDHLFPHVLQRRRLLDNLDGVWNLVLACVDCNRGPAGKMDAVPDSTYVTRVHRRNEYLILSHHPLRETLIHQTGRTTVDRRVFLQRALDVARVSLGIPWKTSPLGAAAF